MDSGTSSTPPQNNPVPTVTRVFRDGASEIQMEYSWQPPNGRHQNSSANEEGASIQPRHHNSHHHHHHHHQVQHQRPKSSHLDSASTTGKLKSDVQGAKEGEERTSFRPATLDTSSTGSHGTRGSNGRWSRSSHVGDSGYGSSELSSPMQYKPPPHLQPPVDSEIQMVGKPANGRSRSSYDITLMGNSGSAWSEPRQQPVFHGPNCECIVCHDMQVRFESSPSLGGSKPYRSLERAHETLGSQRPRFQVLKGELSDKGCAVSGPGYLFIPPRTEAISPPSPNTSGRRSPRVTSPSPPMYQTHFCTHVPGIRRVLSYVPSRKTATPTSCESDPDREAIRLEVADDAYLHALEKKAEMSKPRESWSSSESRPKEKEEATTDHKAESPPLARRRPPKTVDAQSVKEERQRFRYSYPASTPSPSKSKPRIIHIDVYCTEDDEEEEEEESGQGPQLGEDKSQSGDEVRQRTPGVGARDADTPSEERRKSWGGQGTSGQCDTDQRSELDAKTAMFGGAVGNVKKPGRHVGPTRNKNCCCASCQRYYGGVSTAFPSTSDSTTTKGLLRPSDHVGKP